MGKGIVLSEAELRELTDRVRSRTGRAEDARRARVILLLAEGLTWDDVCERAECIRGFVACGLAAFVPSDWPDCTAGTAVRSRFGARRRWRQKILNATRKPADRWQHALEHSPPGGQARGVAHDGGAGVEQASAAAAPVGALHEAPTIRTSSRRLPTSSGCT